MKINRVLVDNRKKSFLIQANGTTYEFPFGVLRTRPSKDDPICHVEVEEEICREGFSYRLKSGKCDTVHIDHVLQFCNDPEYLRGQLLYELTIRAQQELEKCDITKRQLSRRLNTSAAHLYRLLDQTNSHKSIDQMVKLLGALGQKVEVKVKRAA